MSKNIDPASPEGGEEARRIMEEEADRIARKLEEDIANQRKMTNSD